MNLITSDIENVLNWSLSVHSTWGAVLKLTLGLIMLYLQLQYSALIGLGVGAILISLNTKIARLIGKNYHKLINVRDERISFTSDLILGIR